MIRYEESKVVQALLDQEKDLVEALEKTRKMLAIAKDTEQPIQTNLPLKKTGVLGKTHGELILSVLRNSPYALSVSEICDGLRKIGMDGSKKNFYTVIYGDLLRLKKSHKALRIDKKWTFTT